MLRDYYPELTRNVKNLNNKIKNSPIKKLSNDLSGHFLKEGTQTDNVYHSIFNIPIIREAQSKTTRIDHSMLVRMVIAK